MLPDRPCEKMAMSCGVSENACEGTMEAMLPEKEAKDYHHMTDGANCSQKPVLNLELTELDGDVGYSSHGTQDDSSQKSADQINQWQDFNQDELMHGDSDLDDLLYHFNNFFKEKFDSELENFQNSMRSMLREQQIHIRQIVHSTSCTDRDEIVSDSPQHHMDTCDVDIGSTTNNSDPEEAGFSENENHLEVFKEESKSELIQELLSLSCGITGILHDAKYRL